MTHSTVDLSALRNPTGPSLAGKNSPASGPVPMPPWFDWRTFWPLTAGGVMAVMLAVFFVGPLLEPIHEVDTAPILVRDEVGTRASVQAMLATGWVEPSPYPVVVAPLIAGTIAELPVVEGTKIVAGQTIVAKLDTTRIEAKLAVMRADLAEANAELARLDVEIAQAEALMQRNLEARMRAAKLEVEVSDMQHMHINSHAALRAARARLAQNGEARMQLEMRRLEVAQLAGESDTLKREIDAETRQVAFLADSAAAYRKMADGAAASELRAKQAETELAAAGDRLAGLHARFTAIGATLAAARQAMAVAQELAEQPVMLQQEALRAEAEATDWDRHIATAKRELAIAKEEADDPLMRRAELETRRAMRTAQEAKVFAVAQAVAALETDWRLHAIVAPIDGEVMRVMAAPGAAVGPEMPICTVFVPNRLQVRVDLPLADVPAVRLDQSVEIRTEAVPDRFYPGVVERFVRQADLNRNSLQVKIIVTQTDGRLKPDMLSRCKFLPMREAESAVTHGESPGMPTIERFFVPRSAVVESGAESVVFVFDPRGAGEGNEGTARRVVVTVLDTTDAPAADHVEIEGAVSRTHRIVVRGAAGLADGARIKPRSSAASGDNNTP